MKILSVDVGTNSTLYLICDIGEKLIPIERGIFPNHLGSTLDANNHIPDATIGENLKILSSIVELGKQFGCKIIGGVGTHALRQAANGIDLVAGAAKLGLPIEIIDGDREAELNWTGLFGQIGSKVKSAILDIGGGSTELIIGRGWDVRFKESIPVGAVSLAREFTSDPPSDLEFAASHLRLIEIFDSWRDIFPATLPFYGVGGTVTTLKVINLAAPRYFPGFLEGKPLYRRHVHLWREKLFEMTLGERLNILGLPASRAQILPAGSLILETVMKILGQRSITVSEKGIMFGLAWELYKRW